MDDDAKRAHEQELANLGRAFREARERSGLSEREVADAVRGISLDRMEWPGWSGCSVRMVGGLRICVGCRV